MTGRILTTVGHRRPNHRGHAVDPVRGESKGSTQEVGGDPGQTQLSESVYGVLFEVT